VYVDNERVTDAEAVLGPMLHDRFAVLRRGKRTLAAVVRDA
jgi:tyrosyl-tRNA synthetase